MGASRTSFEKLQRDRAKKAKAAVKKALRNVSRARRILRSKRAQQAVDPTLLSQLLATAEGILNDLRTLKGSVSCP